MARSRLRRLGIGDREHPVAALHQVLHLRLDALDVEGNQSLLALVVLVGTHGQHAFRGALDADEAASVAVVEAGGVAKLGLEGDRGDRLVGLEQRHGIAGGLLSQALERDVGRVARPVPLRDAVFAPRKTPLVGQRGGADQPEQPWVLGNHDGTAVQHQLTLGLVTHATHVDTGPAGDHSFHGDLVARERSGLVGGDHAAAAQGLDGGQVADHHPPPRHARDGHRQRHREGDRKAFRNSGDRERDRTQQHLGERLPAREADPDQEQREDECGCSQPAGEALHSPHERRRLRHHSRHLAGDLANLCARAGGHHQAHAAARRDEASGKGHVAALGHRDGGRKRRVRILFDRHGFARQEGLVTAQALRLDQPNVRRHPHAGLEQQQIARDDAFAVDVEGAPRPVHAGTGGHELGQGVHLALRAQLVHEADQRVDQEHGSDEGGVGQLPQEQRDARGHDQNVDQGALELANQDAQPRGRGRRLQAVRTVAREPRLGLLRIEPAGPGLEPLLDRARLEGVPGELARHSGYRMSSRLAVRPDLCHRLGAVFEYGNPRPFVTGPTECGPPRPLIQASPLLISRGNRPKSPSRPTSVRASWRSTSSGVTSTRPARPRPVATPE